MIYFNARFDNKILTSYKLSGHVRELLLRVWLKQPSFLLFLLKENKIYK
jgi:hypothetical protein